MSETDYHSAFGSWDKRSYVRAKPPQDAPFEEGLHYFSPDLTPLLQSEEVLQTISPERREELMVHQLYAYLRFTVRLEMGPVNEIATLLSIPGFLPWIAQDRRSDAIKIYTDEGAHAQMSHSLVARVVEATGIAPLDVEPQFMLELQDLLQNQPPAFQPFVKLFFVIVSETLITGSLNRLPKDERVQKAVRGVADDHAQDEGRHHKYFKSLFQYIWPGLPLQWQTQVGVLLPRMLRAFLAPDRGYLFGVARRFPEELVEPERVVDELMTSPATREGILVSADPSLRIFDSAGLFENPVIAEAFEQNGLLPLKRRDQVA